MSAADLDDTAVAKLIERRRRVRLWWTKDATAADAAWTTDDGVPPVGLALSGGGIRSATFSLGLIQALARSRRNALGQIDVLSSVSGGGYTAAFLRSLFVPAALRGISPHADTVDLHTKADQYRLARTVLSSDTCVREIDWPTNRPDQSSRLRNPLWWLREHSRYLAPSGMTDYGFAFAYIARNWLAMSYLVLLACVALAALIVGAEAGTLELAFYLGAGVPACVPASPLFALAVLPVGFGAMLMIAYWATQAMSTNEATLARQRHSLHMAIALIAVAALASIVLVVVVGRRLPPLGNGFAIVVALGAAAAAAGVLRAWLGAGRLGDRGALLTTELRRTLTLSLAHANYWLLGILIIAGIDTLGALLAGWLRQPEFGLGAGLLPALAYLIKKLPDWFGGAGGVRTDGGGIAGLLRRSAKTIALVAGLLLYGSIATLAFALAHRATWSGDAWTTTPLWGRWLVLAGIAAVLTWVLGKSTGFINLSSLHSLYASRLTRAYLGASNIDRLRDILTDDQAAPINENHTHDYIQPRLYGDTDLPAPIHVINVTLNETIDPRSQIVSRDRKGDILSVEPDGIRVGHALKPWDSIIDPALPKDRRAENISLGQWIAISGAAASSGMGRMTSLGFALAFTFANVRLGYWWWSPRLCGDAPVSTGISGWCGRHLGTFVYLANEMTCRYSRGYYRKYLTDGGHYENSGAYVLIRRRVPLIVVTDNGADPKYDFADLEVLVRQARIDLGAEAQILGGKALADAASRLGATDLSIFVDPDATPDWRARMTDPRESAYVLLLGIEIGGETLLMVWIKPRLLPDVPADLAGYRLAMPAFPQQPTGDQFFDEAQWESYRRLGELSMERLLNACPLLLA